MSVSNRWQALVVALLVVSGGGCGSETVTRTVTDVLPDSSPTTTVTIDGLTATLDGAWLTLQWAPPESTDVAGYQVVRNASPIPGSLAPAAVTHDVQARPWLNRITSTAGWRELLPGPGEYLYSIRPLMSDAKTGSAASTSVVVPAPPPADTTGSGNSSTEPASPPPAASIPCLPLQTLLATRTDLVCVDIASRTTSDTSAPVTARALYAFPISPVHPALAGDAQFGSALLSAEFGNPGSDGIWMTSDDGLTFVEDRLSATTGSSWTITTYAPAGATCVSEILVQEYAIRSAVSSSTWTTYRYGNPGPDRAWKTGDDLLLNWSRTVSTSTQRHTWEQSLPGLDGTWLTADDVTTSVENVALNGSGQATLTTIFLHPGSDLKFDTPDDVPAVQSIQAYDSLGRPVRSVRYEFDWPGTVSRAVAAFELTYSGTDAFPVELRSIRPGPDAILGTTDDTISYGTPASTGCDTWTP